MNNMVLIIPRNVHETQIIISDSFYWTDMIICSSWINTLGKEYQTFVPNGLNESLKLRLIKKWCWLNTNFNPADQLKKYSTDVFKGTLMQI